ncbi:MAG: nicotinate-nucleotide adenylyltransferase [Actinomycetota bacterium]
MSGTGRRIGIMGGTFDPIHNGHLVCAQEAGHQFDIDEVIFLPAGSPWQKSNVTPAEDRYLMTMLATASNEHFSVSRLEIDRLGPSYTVDSLEAFRLFYPQASLFFITGADAVAEILTWKDPEELLSRAHFIAASRPEFEPPDLEHEPIRGRVSLMHIPALAISSTDIRNRVSRGEPIRYLVPREVADFVAQRQLYRSTAGSGAMI